MTKTKTRQRLFSLDECLKGRVQDRLDRQLEIRQARESGTRIHNALNELLDIADNDGAVCINCVLTYRVLNWEEQVQLEYELMKWESNLRKVFFKPPYRVEMVDPWEIKIVRNR